MLKFKSYHSREQMRAAGYVFDDPPVAAYCSKCNERVEWVTTPPPRNKRLPLTWATCRCHFDECAGPTRPGPQPVAAPGPARPGPRPAPAPAQPPTPAPSTTNQRSTPAPLTPKSYSEPEPLSPSETRLVRMEALMMKMAASLEAIRLALVTEHQTANFHRRLGPAQPQPRGPHGPQPSQED